MKRRQIILALVAVFVIGLGIWLAVTFTRPKARIAFDGKRALSLVETQMSFGPRIPAAQAATADNPDTGESSGHKQFVDWAQKEFARRGWQVETQSASLLEHPITNIYAKKGDSGPLIILGAHYDTRMKADQDKMFTEQPVPGANDGASGVAVLLELARSLEVPNDVRVWLVLFDSEDQGRLPGWDWILGSRAAADSLQEQPAAVVIVDMIGDADLNVYLEKNSDPVVRAQIWAVAKKLGYGKKIINQEKHSMLDDHTPFLKKGYPAVDMIDFDYPYWHTIEDTSDKLSASSLEAIGSTLETWIEDYNQLK
jgi:glutaminyl-peptide cyclotransferase